jgi:hypothetical protein
MKKNYWQVDKDLFLFSFVFLVIIIRLPIWYRRIENLLGFFLCYLNFFFLLLFRVRWCWIIWRKKKTFFYINKYTRVYISMNLSFSFSNLM